ncbi:MAG: efflux RND transporter periplasmic adaptor subunit [Acidobacteria bacterium]|nr:efflux RND transporter periplasmic adaptor subunit [Acidobacteriota bacterium]
MNTLHLRRLVLLVVTLLVVGMALSSCARQAATAGKYHCPMHPTYVSDKPGDCPICGMRLVPIETKTQPAQAQKGERKILYYRNPMDPTVTSPVPAEDSMGMDFIPVYADEATSGTGSVPGLAPVDISAEGLKLTGVQTVPAVREHLVRTIRTVGTVGADESRIRHVHTKIAGWVEKLWVNFTGQLVRQGDPLLSIYSRELLSSQEELLRAKEAAARFAKSDIPEVRKGGEDLVQAARRRLQLFDVPDSLIAELERTGTPQRTVTLPAPVSGFVTTKATFEGQQVEPGMELFTITDLSVVWIEADLYEYEARAIRLGQAGRLTLPYETGRVLRGRITYIYPTVNPETRTLRVRFEFANPGFSLKPAMFADVELDVDSGPGLVVPDSAVIDTGERQVVFVAKGDGRFEPRLVQVGARSGGKAQVLTGLVQGDQVVTRANFLLDSESQLRAAIAGMTRGTAKKPGGGAQP